MKILKEAQVQEKSTQNIEVIYKIISKKRKK